jgi:hypothetical protein
MNRIKALLGLNWEIKVLHVHREANRSAYILANRECTHCADISIYNQPPTEVTSTTAANDARGVSYPRLILL